MTPAPTLHTRHLTLRGPEKSDLAPFTAFLTASARMAALGWASTEGEAWRGFIGGIGHWHWHGYGFFTVCDRATGAPLGRVGVLNHIEWPQPELAWHLFDGAEGRGAATEAAIAVRDWYGRTFGAAPLVSLILPDNHRSIRVAERLGATPGATTDATGETCVIHTHLAHDDPAARAQWEAVA